MDVCTFDENRTLLARPLALVPCRRSLAAVPNSNAPRYAFDGLVATSVTRHEYHSKGHVRSLASSPVPFNSFFACLSLSAARFLAAAFSTFPQLDAPNGTYQPRLPDQAGTAGGRMAFEPAIPFLHGFALALEVFVVLVAEEGFLLQGDISFDSRGVVWRCRTASKRLSSEPCPELAQRF